jgi:hypothetical protein
LLQSIPVIGQQNPAAKAVDQFEVFNTGMSAGLMLAVATVSLWSYWAGGLLLSGAGGTEVVESVIKVALSLFAIVIWPDLFKGVVAVVNDMCSAIVNAPFAHHVYEKFAAKIFFSAALQFAAAKVLAAQLGAGLHLSQGLSIASFIATGNPVAWIVDFIVVLMFMVGLLILEIERVALLATTTFIYVTGPIALALTAVRGLTPVTSAFVRIAQAAAITVIVWTVILVLFAILDSAITPIWSMPGLHSWWATVGDSLTAVVMLWILIFTPGIVRRHIGAGGAGATGVLRTAALLTGYRVFRGHSRTGADTRRARRLFSGPRGAGQAPSTGVGRKAGPAPSNAGGRGAGPAPSNGGGGKAGPAPSNGGGGKAGPAPSNGGGRGAGPAPSNGGGGKAGPAPSNGGGRRAGPAPPNGGGGKAGPAPSNGGGGKGGPAPSNGGGRKGGPAPSNGGGQKPGPAPSNGGDPKAGAAPPSRASGAGPAPPRTDLLGANGTTQTSGAPTPSGPGPSGSPTPRGGPSSVSATPPGAPDPAPTGPGTDSTESVPPGAAPARGVVPPSALQPSAEDGSDSDGES